MNPDRRYTFQCPECQKKFTYDQPGEPLCDGPGEFSSHPPEVMRRIRVVDKDLGAKEVGSEEAEIRAKGMLLTPDTIRMNKLRVKGKLWTPKDGDA